MKNIEDKVIAITGGSSGIGEAAARHLASQCAKVVIGAPSNTTAAMSRIVDEIRADGHKAEYYALDVRDRVQMEGFVQHTVDAFGRIDVLINNAGVMPLSPVEALKVDEWDLMVDINIKGVLYGIAAALPVMRKQGSGQFINMASVAGHVITPNSAVYCATKTAVRAVSEGLRQEVGEDIRVTLISPGAVQSNLANSISDQQSRDEEARVRALAIKAEAIAQAMAYAISQPREVDVNEILIRPTAQPF